MGFEFIVSACLQSFKTADMLNKHKRQYNTKSIIHRSISETLTL